MEKSGKKGLGVESSGKFMGAYYRSLDAKGRFLLPPSFLSTLKMANDSGSFWLTSLYGSLTAYLSDDWINIVEQLCKVKIPSRKLANFKTRLIGMAQELVPDNQGRIRIPQSLISAGGLHKEIVLVGILEKFEIWDQGKFELLPTEDVSEELAGSGIKITL